MLSCNHIYQGNCLDFLRQIDDLSVDLTITSPPYDNMRQYEGYSFDFESIAREIYRVTKDGGVLVWVVGDETENFSESLTSFKQAIFMREQCGFNLLDTMIYRKNGGPSPYPGIMRYAPWFEFMFVFSKGKPKTFNPIKDKPTKSGGGIINSGNTARQKDGTTKYVGDYVTESFTTRDNVWTYDVGKGKDTKDAIALDHPARFPEMLAYDHIISWSNENDLVMDPFCGSGTTCKMAKISKRKYIGMDLSKKYCDIARQRIRDIEDCFGEVNGLS